MERVICHADVARCHDVRLGVTCADAESAPRIRPIPLEDRSPLREDQGIATRRSFEVTVQPEVSAKPKPQESGQLRRQVACVAMPVVDDVKEQGLPLSVGPKSAAE